MANESGLSPLAARTVAVVPCYNAGGRVRGVLRALVPLVHRTLVVDDGSTDGCMDDLEREGAEVLRLAGNQGKGFAILEGFRAALEDAAVECVAVLDADGQHDPAELPRLLEVFARKKPGLLIGARSFDGRGRGIPLRSSLGNRVTATVTRALLRHTIGDTQSGYRLHARPFANHVLAHVPGGRYDTEMEILVRAVKGGFRVIEVPIQTLYEKGNPSSHFHFLRDSWRVYHRLFRTALFVRESDSA